jgi:hypothetical protein
MRTMRFTAAGALLLTMTAAACADLVVNNQNEPDRGRALARGSDVESLIASAYQQWYVGEHHVGSPPVGGPAVWLSSASFQHSSSSANFGLLRYTTLPRQPLLNSITNVDYPTIEWGWGQNYRALAAVSEGLRALQANPDLATQLGDERTLRARMYGKFMQGLAHASIALLYDRAYVVDETVQVIDENDEVVIPGDPVPYTQVMNAAMGYFDQAIAIATSAAAEDVEIPATWMAATEDVDAETFARLAHSMKARYRASVARTPQERAAVNWAAVLQDVQQGLQEDFLTDNTYMLNNWGGATTPGYVFGWSSTFQQLTLMVWGMADQSGSYQEWLARPVGERDAFRPDGSPVLIITPDKRFPQGATLTAQAAAPGVLVGIRRSGTAVANQVQFQQPGRGTWRWSQYYHRELDPTSGNQTGVWPEVDARSLRLLAAEALYRTGQLQEAADIVNATRVGVGGLNATNAAGLNTSCVPKLPNGSCGGLLEMIKWEKRLHGWMRGPFISWGYFDGRGWGDLYRGTPLQFPIPQQQAVVLGLGAPYTFGGVGGPSSSPGSTYAWPGE